MPSAAPLVFISFASSDDGQARRLAAGLEADGIEVFVAHRDIEPATNIINAIENVLSVADYFVLLWSRHAVGRGFVNLEWTSALTREIEERRIFLFVVRLDDVPLPRLLSIRLALDARRGVTSVVQELVRLWRHDVRADLDGTPRRPAPHADSGADGQETVGIYIMNSDLAVQHFLRVPPRLSPRQLYARVRTALDLPSSSAALGGHIVIRYHYELSRGDDALDPESDAPVELFDETTLDLAVIVDLPPGRRQPATTSARFRQALDLLATYDEAELAEIRNVQLSDFRHLLP